MIISHKNDLQTKWTRISAVDLESNDSSTEKKFKQEKGGKSDDEKSVAVWSNYFDNMEYKILNICWFYLSCFLIPLYQIVCWY